MINSSLDKIETGEYWPEQYPLVGLARRAFSAWESKRFIGMAGDQKTDPFFHCGGAKKHSSRPSAKA